VVILGDQQKRSVNASSESGEGRVNKRERKPKLRWTY